MTLEEAVEVLARERWLGTDRWRVFSLNYVSCTGYPGVYLTRVDAIFIAEMLDFRRREGHGPDIRGDGPYSACTILEDPDWMVQ